MLVTLYSFLMDAEVNIRNKPEETANQSRARQTEVESDGVEAILNEGSYMSLDDTVIVQNDVSAVEENSECDINGKKRKLKNDSGNLSCKYANYEDVDDENTSRCSQCSCTDLPPYQIVRFMLQGYRKYPCEGCVDILKDLPENCRRDTRLPLLPK